MDYNVIRAFFKWCTIINGGLLILASLLIRFAGDWFFGMHNKWIPITEDSFHVAIYILLGFFKIIVVVFNLVPYVVLVIIGNRCSEIRNA
jgi:hypothetical protein